MLSERVPGNGSFVSTVTNYLRDLAFAVFG